LADLHADGIGIVLTTHDLNGMAAHLPQLICVNKRIVAAGTPAEVITPPVLEKTFGARMEVLQHLGMPVVVDDHVLIPRAELSGRPAVPAPTRVAS
jgi:ABC-type Mn2+/Zn2+ transport system ATPase subunit